MYKIVGITVKNKELTLGGNFASKKEANKFCKEINKQLKEIQKIGGMDSICTEPGKFDQNNIIKNYKVVAK